jgi:hypothetical protein
MKHCLHITSRGREWMEQNPKEKLPADYEKYPGKMDHCTGVVLKIAEFDWNKRKGSWGSNNNNNNNNSSSRPESPILGLQRSGSHNGTTGVSVADSVSPTDDFKKYGLIQNGNLAVPGFADEKPNL